MPLHPEEQIDVLGEFLALPVRIEREAVGLRQSLQTVPDLHVHQTAGLAEGERRENVGEQSAENGEEDGLLGDVAADPTQRLFEGRKQSDGVGNAIRSVEIATFPAR